MRPPATLGRLRAVAALGNPNAHFSVSFGTWSAVSPARSADWNRVLSRSGPHPPQVTAAADASKGGAAVHLPVSDGVARATMRPARYSATARFSAALSSPPCTCIAPDVSAEMIASGVRARSSSTVGIL